jgi:predicted DNA-binding transcriptional regulator AlpA
MGEQIDYDHWYPEVPAVMDTRQMADLLHTNEQIIRGWVREGILPAHRKAGGRKLSFLRHEIFEWLFSNRYVPGVDDS